MLSGAANLLRRLLRSQSRRLARFVASGDAPAEAAHAEVEGKRVCDVMRPRTDVVALSANATEDEVRALVRTERYSRYPVYREDMDDVAGVFLAKDLWLHDGTRPFALADHIRPAPYVPATRSTDRVMEDLRRARAHMAIVLDEFGGTAGIVTLEDVIEEVIGEITDEYDFARDEAVESNGVLELDGAMTLSDARREYGLDIPEGDWNTLGGFVFGELGRLPRMRDRVAFTTGELEVVAMDGRRVAAVRVLPRLSGPTEKTSAP